jgi:oligoendopeptidase F
MPFVYNCVLRRHCYSSHTMKTEWDLQLLYKNAKDPALEQDIKKYEKICADFEKKYKNNLDFLDNEIKLFKALEDYEKLYASTSGSKPIVYFHYRKDLNSEDKEAESFSNKIIQRLTKAGNKCIFFDLALAKIPAQKQKIYLKSKKLKHYKYFLEKIFKTAKYNLSEPEEKILNLKSLPGFGMWVHGQQKLLSSQVVQWKDKMFPLSEAFNILPELKTKERRALNIGSNAVLKSISHFAESEINAVYTDKKINDELRGFEKPYSATILHYLNDEKSIINLVNTVTDHFPISHRFYAIKARMLKLKSLEYADRSARVGKISMKFGFEECVGILKNGFGKAGRSYTDILYSYLKKGQIDVFPKQGKKGGAYCSGTVGLPTFVMLNHVDTFDSLKTFAHEMGHAIHTELSKSETPIYQDYPISIAEAASTLFENFAFDEVFPKLSEKEKIIALHDKINDSVSTVFRQIACFNFELELHEIIRSQGAISKEEIAALHNKHMHAYLGPLFNMKENDGYFFVNWSHIRRFFYVYSYAYGDLISSALYKKFKQDNSYIKKIEIFLKAGSSDSPENIFKSIGIDTSQSGFFKEGLKEIEENIKKLEKLTS